MEPLPKRTSLIHETATTLKEWISRGILRDTLPGELQLKSRLGVGRDTLRHALKILADDGWVTDASKGQQRRVENGRSAKAPPGPEAAVLPVTFLSPNAVECRVTLLELEDTQKRLAQQGRSLRFLAPEIFQLKHPEKQLERIVRTHPSSAWLLHMSNRPMQKWFEENGVPALIYGLPFPGVKLPFVGCDWGLRPIMRASS
jgi:DNA-binding transcriptional MocR family regulator